MARKNNIKLEEINKANPFGVPEHYFENFSVRLSDKLSQTEKVKTTAFSFAWLHSRATVILAFASIALILLIGVIFVNYRNKPLSSKEMIEAYKYSAIQDLSDEQLAEMMNNNRKEKQLDPDSVSKANEKYKDEIIEYLSNENIDINTIVDSQ